jgi:cell pole-organizing protein PopZ
MVGREFKHLLPALAAAIVLLAGGVPAQAVSMKDCSARYKAAQAAGSTTGWNEFRKQECAKAASAAAETASPEAKPEIAPKAAPTAGVPKSLVFPGAVSSKFAAEKPAKARMHTCLEHYHINKDNNTLGGMRWIEKGGGYYKLCNNKLKGIS